MKKRLLITSIVMMLVVAVALSTATYAWFSANTKVTATGMQVKATSSESLVISTTKPVGNQTQIAFASEAKTLIPATHDLTEVAVDSSIAAANTDTTKTGLKYNNNPAAVGSYTGVANSSTALTFAKAANSTSYYYEDYTLYIASAGDEMTGKKLQAYLYTGAAISTDTQKAVSVDFYVSQDSTNMGKYVGTLNLSSLTADANANGHTYYTGNQDIALSDTKIPQNGKSDDFIQITMRVYYDGALVKTTQALTEITVADSKAQADTHYYDQYGNEQNVVVGTTVVTGMYTGTVGQTYVNSDEVSTNATAFNVNFTVVAA